MKIRSCLAAAVWLLTTTANAIYPDDHFDFVTKINDSDALNDFVTSSTGKTALVRWIATPAWNRAVRAFQGNNDVVFGDVNLAEAADVRGPPHNPGSGGWPTIRYFNAETGVDGGSYVKKTTKSVCDELGTFDAMVDYIEEYGHTVLCGLDGRNCNQQETEFMERMSRKTLEELHQENQRLLGMDVGQLQEGLQEWNLRRRRILSKMIASSAEVTAPVDEL